MPQQPGLGRQQQPPLPLVQMRQQHLELQRQLIANLGQDRHTSASNPKSRTTALFPYGFTRRPNVLAALPKSAHPGAKKALAEIWGAGDKDHARAAVKAFDAAYEAKFPKAAAKITDDADQLLAFYDLPAEHWVHLRTTNPIESTFATVRHRTKVTKGPGSRAAGLAMAFKLIQSAQDHWRMVNAPHLVALARAGATFTGGKIVERPGEKTQPEAA